MLLDVYCCTDGTSILHSAKEANRKGIPYRKDILGFCVATVQCKSSNVLT